jgi:mannose-1-phosphate guanylyltransferase
MDAVLLVGGQGTRLRPLTATTPKPMLPAAGVPFLTHLLVRARDAGVDHAILSTSYKAEVFEEHFGDGERLGLRISYVTETEPLGTGGGIRNVAHLLTREHFLVFNGDVLSGLDLRSLVAAHLAGGAEATLHLTEVADPRAFGLVPLDPAGRVTAFLEKPQRPEEIVSNLINAGCYVFARSVLDAIPTGRPVSVERETFPGLLESGATLLGHVDSTYWLDLGTPAAFITGSVDLVLGRVASSAVPAVGDSLLLPGADVAPQADVGGGTTIGARSVVGAGAVVDASVVFDDVVIEPGAVVRRSALGRGSFVGQDAVLDGVVLGDGARVGAGNELLAGARVWPGVVLTDGAIRFSSDR